MTNLLWRLGLGFNRFVLTWDQNGFYVPTYVRLPAVGTMQHSSTGMHVHSSVCVCACVPASTPSPTPRVSDGTRSGVAVRGTRDCHRWYHPPLMCGIFNVHNHDLSASLCVHTRATAPCSTQQPDSTVLKTD